MTVTATIRALSDLKNYPQWICADLEKKPRHPSGYQISPTDPDEWSTFSAVLRAKKERPEEIIGLGYGLLKEQVITVVDLDHCIVDDQISEFAKKVVALLNSYTEYSVSHTGLHIYVKGNIPKNIGSDSKSSIQIEMYDHKRYIIVTGEQFAGTPNTFEDRQEELTNLHTEICSIRERERLARPELDQGEKEDSTGNHSAYGRSALGSECWQVATTTEGGRNKRLNDAALKLGRLVAGGELSEDEVKDALQDAARQCGLSENEILPTIESGLRAGKQQPRSRPTKEESAKDTPFVENKRLCDFDPDDSGNGDAVYSVYGNSFLYCAAYGWLTHTGTHWKRMSDDSAIKKATVSVLRKRRIEAVKEDKEHVVKCTAASAKNVNGAIDRFKSLVSVPVEIFDNEPDLFNAQNGVIDLRDGSLTPHSSSQRFTWCAPVPYASGDPALWLEQLKETVGGGQEMIDYLQLALGYSLTGHTSEECLFYPYGPSRSGKGTVSETMQALFPSPLAESIDFTSLTARRAEDTNNFDLARLKPSRMVFASESNRSQPLNTSKIKSITGGDNITASHKHKDAFTFRPQFKLWMLSNWPVNGDPEDDALWGRVRVIEFPHSFLGKEDKSRKARLKSPESLQAILYWCVQGSIKWYKLGAQGLAIPKKVADATKKHRDELDFIAQWLAECTETKPGEWTSNEDIKTSYINWCEDNNVTPKKARNFALSLQIKGYETGVQKKVTSINHTSINHKGVAGLCLKSNPDIKKQLAFTLSVTDGVTVTDGTEGTKEKPLYAYNGKSSEPSVPSVTVTPSVTDDQINRELVESFLSRVLAGKKDQEKINWTVKSDVYPKGVITVKEFRHRVNVALSAGGDELCQVKDMLRNRPEVQG